MKLIKTIKKILFGSTFRGFVVSYLIAMFIGALFLKLPLSIQSGQTLSFIDALFISASALSTTGLTPIVVKDVLSPTGQIILLLIIQFGGIGLIMGVALFWFIIGHKITFKQRDMIMVDQNQYTRSGVVRFVRNVLIMIFIIQLTGFILMSSYFILSDTFGVSQALFQALFNTVSLFTNAGFDISPIGSSFSMYRDSYFMLSLSMALMFMGAMGFWPLAEIKMWFDARRKKEKYKFTVFTKLLVSLHAGVWLLSAVALFLLERQSYLANSNMLDSVFVSLFMSLTTRNAGFSTMNVANFNEATTVFFMFLMFLGSSPNSAGGGVRTVTFFVTILAIASFALGKKAVVYKERTIKQETVMKSMVMVIMAFIWVGFITQSILIVEDFSYKQIAFEVLSAFGTTGLSLGITSELSIFSRALLVATMFVGRVSLVSLLLMFKRKGGEKSNIQYPEMDMIVG